MKDYGYEYPTPGPIDKMLDRISDACDEKLSTLIGTIGAILIFAALIFTSLILMAEAVPESPRYEEVMR